MRKAALLPLLLTCLACSGTARVDRLPSELLERMLWPPDDPRVRLEDVVRLEVRPRGGRKVLALIGGSEAPVVTDPFRRPYAVAWDGDDLLIADPDARRLVRVDPEGKLTFSSAAGLESPIGIASCAAGIVVSDSATGEVTLYDRDLRRQRVLAEGLERPTGVACSEGRVFVVETGAHRVLVLEADGSRGHLGRRGEGLGELNFPTAVTVDGSSLWVGDTLNFRAQRFDLRSGEAHDSIGHLGDAPGETPRLKGLAVDAAGNLWITDAHLDQVAIFAPDGQLLMSLGGTGSEPGSFSFPAGLAARADGRVAVVDSLNRRLQVFRLVERGPGERAEERP